MQKTFVLTLTGRDRIGFVDEMTGLVLQHGGNVETSRMIRLGGEFAILMLVAMPADQFSGLEHDLEGLAARGYKVTMAPSDRTYAEVYPGWHPTRSRSKGPITRGSSTRSLTTSRNRASVSKLWIPSRPLRPPAAFLCSP